MPNYGPDERDLFEKGSSLLYDEIVAAGGLSAADTRIAEGAEERPAFDLLVELGLVYLDKGTDTWLPEDPSGIQSRVVTPLSHEGSRLLEESSSWARAFGMLNQSWRRSPNAPSTSNGPFTYIQGDAINPFLTGLVTDAEDEILTAQPQTGRNAPSLAAAALRDTAALDRGVGMRTLYQHSARRSSITHKYVAAVTSRGAQVRTLDEFFNRMIVIDRRVVVIPGETFQVAIAVREPSVVAYLVDVFERAWERGRPFTNSETSTMREIVAEQRAMTIRMLIEGHSDGASAKRLGVSARTYAGYVADLKSEFQADTRFQLGYVMGRQGISGHEPPPADHAAAD